MDDIFEDITSKWSISLETVPDNRDPSGITLSQDLVFLASLDCVRCAMDRVCEVKGTLPLYLSTQFRMPISLDRNHARPCRVSVFTNKTPELPAG